MRGANTKIETTAFEFHKTQTWLATFQVLHGEHGHLQTHVQGGGGWRLSGPGGLILGYEGVTPGLLTSVAGLAKQSLDLRLARDL